MSQATISRGTVVSATLWVGAMLVIGQAAMGIQGIFVSRWFAREEVGVIAILLMMQRGIQAFTEMGHETALIQRTDERLSEVVNTAWVAAIVRGCVLTLLLALAAPHVAAFYGVPELTILIRGTALFFAIIGFKNLHLVQLIRTMRLARPKALSAGAMLVGLAVTIAVGLATSSIWCVVVGGIAQRIFEVVGSHLLAPERSRFRFVWQDFKALFRYGRHIQAVAILVFLVTQLDDAVVGKVVSVEALGVYMCAYLLANLPMTQVVGIASQVATPAWSKVVRDGTIAERNAMFVSTIRFTIALSVALFVALFVGGADLIELVLGAKWRDAEAPLRILVIFSLWRSIGSNFGALFNSIGRPDFILREISVKVLLIAASIYPMTAAWGIIGASWSVTLPMLVITPVASWIYLGIAEVDRRKAFRTFTWPALLGSGTLAVWWTFVSMPWWEYLSVLTRGLWVPLASFAACFGACLLFDPKLRDVLSQVRGRRDQVGP